MMKRVNLEDLDKVGQIIRAYRLSYSQLVVPYIDDEGGMVEESKITEHVRAALKEKFSPTYLITALTTLTREGIIIKARVRGKFHYILDEQTALKDYISKIEENPNFNLTRKDNDVSIA